MNTLKNIIKGHILIFEVLCVWSRFRKYNAGYYYYLPVYIIDYCYAI